VATVAEGGLCKLL